MCFLLLLFNTSIQLRIRNSACNVLGCLLKGLCAGWIPPHHLELSTLACSYIWYAHSENLFEFLAKASVFIENSWIYPLVMQLNAQPNYQTTTFKIIEYIFRYAAQLVKKEWKTGGNRTRTRHSRSSTYCNRKFYLHEMMWWVHFHVDRRIGRETNTIDIATTETLCTLPFVWNKTLRSCTESLFAV